MKALKQQNHGQETEYMIQYKNAVGTASKCDQIDLSNIGLRSRRQNQNGDERVQIVLNNVEQWTLNRIYFVEDWIMELCVLVPSWQEDCEID